MMSDVSNGVEIFERNPREWDEILHLSETLKDEIREMKLCLNGSVLNEKNSKSNGVVSDQSEDE